MKYSEVLEEVKSILKELYLVKGISTSTLFDWQDQVVHIIHEEGFTAFFMYAALIEVENKWIVVVSEHQGYYVYDKEDLLHYGQYKANQHSNLEDLTTND